MERGVTRGVHAFERVAERSRILQAALLFLRYQHRRM